MSELQNLCLGCGIDMGSGNPRQYCRKTWCPKSSDDFLSFYSEKNSEPIPKKIKISDDDKLKMLETKVESLDKKIKEIELIIAKNQLKK